MYIIIILYCTDFKLVFNTIINNEFYKTYNNIKSYFSL